MKEIKERRLSYARNQFEIAKLQAMYWHGMAVTGAATTRNTAVGRDPTDEEKTQGLTIGWRPHTNEEKTEQALKTMARHIERMSELNDFIDNLLNADFEIV